MTYYVYQNPIGVRHVLTHKLPEGTEGDFTFLYESETPPDIRPKPGYAEMRQGNYPPIGEQLDMLWHAMDESRIPRAEPFYSEILAIKRRYPKPSN